MNNNGGSSSTPLAAAAAETTALAPGFRLPGFRFHPTDEELVSFYLKRKVCGKPFKFDPISELDLYKSEPWDLPAKSRIQTRDKEWYFFSTLDKKYATRSRTNRATGQGFWKTTGKDRPVRRNSRVVGMKKTLVFHVGRAPKGERTNWVMHEYRLEDENMTRTGIEQDAYVVCRIFQKTGSGPQNGAQYGAPVVDDWEEEDTDLVPKEEVCKEEDLEFDFNSPEFLRLIDFMENEEMGTGNENTTASVNSDNGRDGFNYQVELAGIWQDENVVNGADGNINVPGLPDGQTLTGMDENSQCLAGSKDEYVEVNDFTDSVEGLRNYHKSINGVGESSNLPELNDGEEFFKTIDENNTLSEPSQIFPTAENNYYLKVDDFGISDFVDYPSGEPFDDGMLQFDAPSHDPTTEQSYIHQMNDLLNPTMADSTGIDMAEELLAYFDVPEDNSQYTVMHPNLGNSNSATSFILDPYSSQANGVSIQAYDTCPQALEASGDRAASSSMKASETGGGSKVPEVVQSDDGNGEKKTLMNRLVSMLGSIPSPPASAAELPLKGGKSLELSTASLSSRSIHFTAGMIQINGGLTRTGSGKHCSSVQEDGKVGFLLSFGMSRNDVVGNTKMHGGTMSLVLQSSCCRLFFSLLILAVSFKVGVCFYAS